MTASVHRPRRRPRTPRRPQSWPRTPPSPHRREQRRSPGSAAPGEHRSDALAGHGTHAGADQGDEPPRESTATSTVHKAESPSTSPPAGAAPPKESAKERKAREAKERDAKEQLRLAAATPAIVATGTVRIAVSPWGNVEVDGAASGAAPPLTQLTLAEGRHQIVVRNGDFAPFVATINVVAGQTTSIRHKFGSGG
jgi:hypothetical protein